MSSFIFECECGLKIPMREEEFPLHCRCGQVHYLESRSEIDINRIRDCNILEFTSTPVFKSECLFGPASLSNVTACITFYLRTNSLNNLVQSIRKYYPTIEINAIDTKGNLSKGRNQLVQQCKTDFCLILEEDFEFVNSTKIEPLCHILNLDNEVGVVAGALTENNRIRNFDYRDMNLFRGVMELYNPPKYDWIKGENGVRYRYADMVSNFFLARKSVLLENPWDEDLYLMEHAPWFWQLKQKGQWRVAFTDSTTITHHRDRDNPQYKAARINFQACRSISQKKYGFAYTSLPVFARSSILRSELYNKKPNILILGVGHTGSRLFAGILQKLGWNLGDHSSTYMENTDFVNINRTILRHMGLSNRSDESINVNNITQEYLGSFFSNLVEPWVLKDPRLVLTIRDPILRSYIDHYQPFLLYIERDVEKVKQSYLKESPGFSTIWGLTLEEVFDRAKEEYEVYPYSKLFLRFEDVIESAKLVDFERAI